MSKQAKRETKDVEKTKVEADNVMTSQLMSRHNRREITKDMSQHLNLCCDNNWRESWRNNRKL